MSEPRPLHLKWDGDEWKDVRCGCAYHPIDQNNTHGGGPHVHPCETHELTLYMVSTMGPGRGAGFSGITQAKTKTYALAVFIVMARQLGMDDPTINDISSILPKINELTLVVKGKVVDSTGL